MDDQNFNQQYQQPQQTQAQKDDHNANLMCIISLICQFVVPFVFVGLLSFSSRFMDINSPVRSAFALGGYGLSGLAGIAAWVLVIIVRVKYPKNTFGKVLMWVYIGLLILSIILTILIILACAEMVRSCS